MTRRLTSKALVLVLIWFILNGTDGASWIIGVPTILLAVALASLIPKQETPAFHLAATTSFLPFFLRYSVVGAWDVALRALKPRMNLRPATLHYRTTLPRGLPSVIFADATTLLPGTLTMSMDDDVVTCHVLDVDADPAAGLNQLETKVKRLFRHQA